MPVDRKSLPKDPTILQDMLVDVTQQLDKTQRLLQQLLTARSGTRSEKLSADQLRLFAQELELSSRRNRTPTKKMIPMTNHPSQTVVARRSRVDAVGCLRT